MSEGDLMRRLQIRASELGARLFRQNTGLAWIGKAEQFHAPRMIRVNRGDVLVRNARSFRAGFKGMSDIGGWVPVTITHEMVGMTFARYAQVEVKFGDGRVSTEQAAWIKAVSEAGGRAGVARSVEDLEKILG